MIAVFSKRGICLFVFIFFFSFFTRAYEKNSNLIFDNHSSFLTIAHRGGSALWPENTLHAFRKSIELGVDVIDMDVRMSLDGHLVIMHDSTLERTTDGRGKVKELNLSQLKKLDAAYFWDPEQNHSYPLRGTGIKIPTLEEVFESFRGAGINIEIKQLSPSIVKPLCNLIKKYNLKQKVIVGAFLSSTINSFRRTCPEVATSASTGEILDFYYSTLDEDFYDSYNLKADLLQVPQNLGSLEIISKNFIEAAHSKNIPVQVWTINDTDTMKNLIQLGVDGIFTDHPDRLLSVLER